MIFFYRIFINLILVFSPIIILIRLFKKKEDLKRFQEKFCFFSKKKTKDNLIWIHVASVGELMSVIPLIYKLEREKKIHQILVTSTTVSSANIFSKLKFKKTIHQYFPIDTNYFTQKFLNYWKPKLVIFIESEIWPNMLINLRKKSINHILLNARITNRTFKKWDKINFFSKELFKSFSAVYPQNLETKKYLKILGCNKIKTLGNLKFTTSHENIDDAIDKEISKKKIIWCASSTHNPEEIIAAKAHINLKKDIKTLLTIIIPRHIHRKNKIFNELRKLNLKIHLHSSKKKISNETDIYLVDTYGETKKFFKLSSVVFLGGSIINHGGQNPLEAARFGSKILHGKYIKNFLEIYSLLKKNNQSKQINSQNDLNLTLKKVLIQKNKSDIFIKKLNKTGNVILKNTVAEIIRII
jgi:3-deoxy-D-manno-octulosonic-acid transferase